MDYTFHLLTLAALYGVLAISLDLVVGHLGLVNLSQAAFYGLGAYTSALLTVQAGWPFLTGWVAGMGVAAGLSLLVSLPSFRLRDDYFVLSTFGFQMILWSLFNNWAELTRGPLGISGIPHPGLAGFKVETPLGFLLLAAGLLGIVKLALGRLTGSPFGRVLRALRESEPLVRSFGKDPRRFKVSAFAVSAAGAAAAGSLYAHYIRYVDPSSFTFLESVLVLSMVILGGAASPWGPLLGAGVLVFLPEGLRFVGLSSAVAAPLRQILYGAALVWMMRYQPRGWLGRWELGR